MISSLGLLGKLGNSLMITDLLEQLKKICGNSIIIIVSNYTSKFMCVCSTCCEWVQLPCLTCSFVLYYCRMNVEKQPCLLHVPRVIMIQQLYSSTTGLM